MSYLTIEELQYGESQAQGRELLRPHVPAPIARASTSFDAMCLAGDTNTTT
jgi:hypothetical protein